MVYVTPTIRADGLTGLLFEIWLDSLPPIFLILPYAEKMEDVKNWGLIVWNEEIQKNYEKRRK